MTMKQLNPFNCPETFTVLSLIAFAGLLITIISVTILLFRQLGTVALDEIKDSVVKSINSKKGGTKMDTAKKKPECKLIGEDGNIFNLLGIASNTLKKNGQSDDAKEMTDRVWNSKNYNEALSIIGEYVEII